MQKQKNENNVDANGFYVAKHKKKRLTILSIVPMGRVGFVRPCLSAVSEEHRSATSFRTTAFNTTLSDEAQRSKRKRYDRCVISFRLRP